MTNLTSQEIVLSGDALTQALAVLRSMLLAAGVETVRFRIEEANDGGHQAAQAAMVGSDGAVVGDRHLNAQVLGVLTALVDERVPGWATGDGGRSQIDWAVRVDAMDHRHYDNVKFEQRVLGTASAANSSTILADNAIAAVLLAMGSVAPTDRSSIQHLRDGLRVLVDKTRSDQVRFLNAAQRELLIEAIAGSRVQKGSEDEWIADVVVHGYMGYEHAPDIDLIQKLALETLDGVVEGIRGPMHIVGGSDEELGTRQALIEVFMMPESQEALKAIADAWGDDMLQSLPEPVEHEPEAAGQEAPTQ